MNINISQVKAWREEIGATRLVVFAVSRDGVQYVATHGETEQDAKDAANAGNSLKAHLGWPEESCRSMPLERICKNCAYYQPDRGIFCVNGWSDDGSRGRCMYSPTRVFTRSIDKCGSFEPST